MRDAMKVVEAVYAVLPSIAPLAGGRRVIDGAGIELHGGAVKSKSGRREFGKGGTVGMLSVCGSFTSRQHVGVAGDGRLVDVIGAGLGGWRRPPYP